jgi:hypothetical protein
MATICVPSVIYGCQLHCWDSNDESLGDWYSPNPACAIAPPRDLTSLENDIKDIMKGKKKDSSNTIRYIQTQIDIYQSILNKLQYTDSEYGINNKKCSCSNSNFTNPNKSKK